LYQRITVELCHQIIDALPADAPVLCVAMLMVARGSDEQAVAKGIRILNEAGVEGL
jgi:hypothetical protein